MNDKRIVLGIAAIAAAGLLAGAGWSRLAHEGARAGGRATVTVYDDGQPLAGRPVIFHHPDGSIAAATTSGDDGKASADVQAGGMVTVAYGNSARQLVTILGVMPGDQLVVGELEDEGGPGRTVTMAHVAMPGPYPGATRYAASLGVGPTELRHAKDAVAMPVLHRFVGADRRFRVLGEALDSRGEPVAYTFDSPALTPNGGADVDVLLPEWSTDWRELRFFLDNAPAGLTSASGRLALLSGDDDTFERGTRETALAAGSVATLRFIAPRPLGSDGTIDIALGYGASADKATLRRRARAMPSDIAIDLRAELLPRVSNARVDAADVARPTARWEVAGKSAHTDATIVQLAWPKTREHVWTFVAPPGQKELRVPALPAALRDWQPTKRSPRVAVALVGASFYDGFDDVRRKGIKLLAEPPEEPQAISVVTSMTGDVAF